MADSTLVEEVARAICPGSYVNLPKIWLERAEKAILVMEQHHTAAYLATQERAAHPPIRVYDMGQRENERCLYLACGERAPEMANRWWYEYGCCSGAHAVLHYGEDVINDG